MKKMLSVLLAAVLMLSCGVSAWAAEEPAGNHSHTISDIYIISNSEVIDLSNITVELDVTQDAGRKTGRLHVNKDGETVGEFGITVMDGGLHVLHLDSATLGHKDYGVDPKVILTHAINNLTELLKEIDAESLAQSIVDWVIAANEGTDAVEAPEAEEEPEAEEAPADDAAAPGLTITINDQVVDLASISFEGDPVELILSCINEPETTHMGGTEYGLDGGAIDLPDGDYVTQTFEFDTETICKLLNMVYVDGEPTGLGDKFQKAGVDFLFSGTFYDNDAAHLGQISASLSSDEFSYTAGGGYTQLITEEGKKTIFSYGTSSGTDPETMQISGLSFTVTEGTHDGEQFTPASINEDEIIMLTDMEGEAAQEEMVQSLSVLLGDMLTPFLEPFMAAMDTDGVTADAAE